MSDAEKTDKTKDEKATNAEESAAKEANEDESSEEESSDEGSSEEESSDEGSSEEESTDESAEEEPVAAKAKKPLVTGEDLDLSDDPELAKEELALAERRSKLKKKGQGKAALAKAASKKLAEVRDKRKSREARDGASQAVDAADPLLARTNQVGGWLDNNQRTVQTVGGLLVVGLVGAGGYLYYQQKHEADASIQLSKAVADDRGLVGEAPPEDDENRIKDPRPIFKTAEERRESALKRYKDVQSKFPGTGAAFLARLGEASVLLDKRDADGAIAAYTEAKGTPLSAADVEVKGRATEGLGFAYELKARLVPAEKDKNLDLALAEFKALENVVDAKGFKELGMYHQSRVMQAKGDSAKAKELLLAVRERLSKPGENHPFAYLEEMATDRLRMLDPKAVPPKPKYNEAQLQQMLEKLRGQQGGGGGGGLGDDDE